MADSRIQGFNIDDQFDLSKSPVAVQQREILKILNEEIEMNNKRLKYNSYYIPSSLSTSSVFVGKVFTNAKSEREVQLDNQRASELSKLLKLPEGVAIVCGLTIGYPREIPDKRPKHEQSLFIHHNQYSDNGVVEKLERYDDVIGRHNESHTLARYIPWSQQMVDYYEESINKHTMAYYREQGFGIDKEPNL